MQISEALRFGLRISALLGLTALFAACVNLGGGSDAAPRQVQVTSDAVTITGPRGFCVDPTSTRNDSDTAFVLLGNCAAISGRASATQPDIPAVLTAAVAARAAEESGLTGNLVALDAFFQSEQGRAVLSRSGNAVDVTILETRISGDMLLLHARDTGAGAVVGVAQDYWRAYMDLGPRLATLSVLALADRDVSDEAALRVLTAFAEVVQAANSGAVVQAGAADLPQANDEATGGLFRTGLFQRIFQ